MSHQDWEPVVINKSKPILTNKINKPIINESDEIEKKKIYH